MKLYLISKTQLGKWSIWLIITFIVLFISFQLLVASGQRGGDTFFSNLVLSVPMLIAGISGIAAFFTGIVGIIKNKERSVLVFISTIIGFLILY
jgi:lipopolysaccharide export LptBFGC system permease protein LptF